MIKNLTYLALCLFLSACSSAPYIPGPAMDKVYDDINNQGKKDAIKILRLGMSSRTGRGVTDPIYPLRTGESVHPVWVIKDHNPISGRLVEDHWEYLIRGESEWVR